MKKNPYPQSTIGRFVPASLQDFKDRAKALKRASEVTLESPLALQECQETLASAFGYRDLHELHQVLSRRPQGTHLHVHQLDYAMEDRLATCVVEVILWRAYRAAKLDPTDPDVTTDDMYRAVYRPGLDDLFYAINYLNLFAPPVEHRQGVRTFFALYPRGSDAGLAAWARAQEPGNFAHAIRTPGVGLQFMVNDDAMVSHEYVDGLVAGLDSSPGRLDASARWPRQQLAALIKAQQGNLWARAWEVILDSASSDVLSTPSGVFDLLGRAHLAIALFEHVLYTHPVRHVSLAQIQEHDITVERELYARLLMASMGVAGLCGQAELAAEWGHRALQFPGDSDGQRTTIVNSILLCELTGGVRVRAPHGIKAWKPLIKMAQAFHWNSRKKWTSAIVEATREVPALALYSPRQTADGGLEVPDEAPVELRKFFAATAPFWKFRGNGQRLCMSLADTQVRDAALRVDRDPSLENRALLHLAIYRSAERVLNEEALAVMERNALDFVH